jgi:hypothetical protein
MLVNCKLPMMYLIAFHPPGFLVEPGAGGVGGVSCSSED